MKASLAFRQGENADDQGSGAVSTVAFSLLALVVSALFMMI